MACTKTGKGMPQRRAKKSSILFVVKKLEKKQKKKTSVKYNFNMNVQSLPA